MNRLVSSLLVIFVLITTLSFPPIAVGAPPARDCANAFVQINSPRSGSTVAGTVGVVGSVTLGSGDFDHYKVEFSTVGLNAWVVLVDNVHSQVFNEALALWNTTPLPDGAYSLRLLAIDHSGNYCEAFASPLIVRRHAPPAAPTATTIPFDPPTPTRDVLTRTPVGKKTAVATLGPTLGPTSTPTLVPTLSIDVASDPKQSENTATPTSRTRNVAGASLVPIDLSAIGNAFGEMFGQLGHAFIFGVQVTAGLFVLLGVVVFLRRTL